MPVIPEELVEKLLQKKVFLSLAAINVLGTLFGFYYYADQLSANPVHLWPFIPDSPLATLFIALSFTLAAYKKESGLIDALAFIGNLKYGLWTVFTLLYYYEIFYTGNPLPMYLFMLFSHVAMAVQAFLVLEYSEISLKQFTVGSSWFVLNDVLDYSLGIHTELYTTQTGPAMVVAVLLTLGSIYLLYRLQGSLSERLQQIRLLQRPC